MFQFRRFPSYAYFVQRRMTGYCPAGLPHSDIPGSMDICSSPRLFAACHVLLRLLMPRHSPCALSSLTYRRSHSDLSENSWFSLRIMQALQRSKLYVTLHPFGCCSTINLLRHVFPHDASLLPYLLCHIVQFSRCRTPASLEARSKHSSSLKCFDPVSTLVEISGFEPLTSCLQGRRSPS